ncbi:hypothetical protein [Curvivirga sp.]|uniref:hypothetical protein n=1 Tax=Curvivirga sp. TaxID=2856848 RepID=UPI003B5C121C
MRTTPSVICKLYIVNRLIVIVLNILNWTLDQNETLSLINIEILTLYLIEESLYDEDKDTPENIS